MSHNKRAAVFLHLSTNTNLNPRFLFQVNLAFNTFWDFSYINHLMNHHHLYERVVLKNHNDSWLNMFSSYCVSGMLAHTFAVTDQLCECLPDSTLLYSCFEITKPTLSFARGTLCLMIANANAFFSTFSHRSAIVYYVFPVYRFKGTHHSVSISYLQVYSEWGDGVEISWVTWWMNDGGMKNGYG